MKTSNVNTDVILLSVDENLQVKALWHDDLEDVLPCLGEVNLSRASHVEPRGRYWYADLAPVGGPEFGPFTKRQDAINAEIDWISKNVFGINLEECDIKSE